MGLYRCCNNCRYSGAVDGRRYSVHNSPLQCRRYPPVMVEMPAEPIQSMMGPPLKPIAPRFFWPVVNPEDWCGEFMPDRE